MGSPVQYLSEPGRLTAVWRTSPVEPRPEVWFTFQQFRPDHGKLQAEVTVESHLGLRPIRMVLTLQSESARTELRRACEELLPAGKGYWKTRVDSSCWCVIDQHRTGEAPLVLTGQSAPGDLRWFLDRWIPWGVPTILYGDGGSGKSLMALALGVHALTGHPLGGDPNWRLSPMTGLLIADWEDTAEEFNERLGGLCAGLGVAVPDGIVYKRMQGPLRDTAAELRSLMLHHGLNGCLIDSGSVAAGGELEASETALAFADILRALPGTILVTCHVPWSQTEVEGRRRPFGSIFFRNAFRSLIELRAAPDDGVAGLHLTCRLEKANRVPLPLPPAVGWQFTWEGGGVTIRPAEGATSMISLGRRVLEATPYAPAWTTVTRLTEELGEKRDSIKQTLHRLKKRDMVDCDEGQTSPTEERQWFRKHRPVTASVTTRDSDEPPF